MLKYYFNISLVALLFFGHTRADDNTLKIEAALLTELEVGSLANVVVFFENGNEPGITRAASLTLDTEDKNFRYQINVDELKSHSTESQSGVVQILTSIRSLNEASPGFTDFKQYWLGNKLFIQDASLDTVKEVCSDPQVRIIRKEPFAVIPSFDQIGETVEVDNADFSEDLEEEYTGTPREPLLKGLYGLKLSKIKETWTDFGIRGEGVHVGSIDTGVQASHDALAENFVGVNYGWFDAVEGDSEPGRFGLHGTHTMGTFVGRLGIGVAPDATWMTCRGCDENLDCPGQALLDCFKFLTCPTLPDGTGEDCSKHPSIVSNSWYIERDNEFFEDEVRAWRNMGIIPVFIVGNEGPGCGTTGSPGEYPDVIGVGATDKDDNVYEKSGIGTASNGDIKPDVVASGVEISSAVTSETSNSAYGLHTGTSMAGPLAAGVLALIKSKYPDLTYDDLHDKLTSSTDRTMGLTPGVSYCADGSIDTYPNIFCGHGRVNAYNAM